MTEDEAKEVLLNVGNFTKEAFKVSIKSLDDIIKIKDITALALRSEDPINLYKARALDEIAKILGIELKAPDPAEDPDSKDQITIDDII